MMKGKFSGNLDYGTIAVSLVGHAYVGSKLVIRNFAMDDLALQFGLIGEAGGSGASGQILAAIADIEANKVDQAVFNREVEDREALGAELLAAIDAGDAAQSKARQDADQALAAIIAEGDAGEASAREIGDAAILQTVDDAFKALVAYPESAGDHSRPGDGPRFFASETDEALAALSDSAITASPFGTVAQISGAGIVAPIAAFRFEPGRDYLIRFVVRRAVDTDDPASDAIRLALRWLKADKSGLSTEILADLLDIYAVAGRLEYTFRISTVGRDGIDAAPPAGAVYGRPFVQAFGGGKTHVEVIQVSDLSMAINWSPDVADLKRQIASQAYQIGMLTDRLDALTAR